MTWQSSMPFKAVLMVKAAVAERPRIRMIMRYGSCRERAVVPRRE